MLAKEIMFLRGHAIVMDLIIIDMPDFNMILGMDFLSKYEAKINCRKKIVIFSMDDRTQFTFKEG